MENFENWNKNVKKRDLNSNENANLNDSNQRDYDKEPIVIKNPYEFFLSNLFFFLIAERCLFYWFMPIICGLQILAIFFYGLFLELAFYISSLHSIIILSKTNVKPNLQIKRLNLS